MASKTPLLRAIAQRQYAAGQAATKPFSAQGTTTHEVKTTTLPNKMIVSSVDNNCPIARVSILFRAGSRSETADNFGVSHVLRIAAGLGTKTSTQFAITRNLQQVGANLSAEVGREHVAYTLESTKDNIESSLHFLTEVATQQVFKPWELGDNVARLRYELAGLSPGARAVDLLHKAAYRSGLGNSLFCPDYLVGKHSSETLQHYVAQLFRTNRTAVAGVGVNQDLLVPMAQSLSLDSGVGPDSPKSAFHAGEIRVDNGSNLTVIALATEGAALGKEALVYAVLHRLLGAGSNIKWSDGASASPLSRAAAAAAGSESTAASAFNTSYSDSGLFGAVVISPASVAGKVAEAAARSLRSLSVTDAEVQRAKAQLKAAALFEVESGSGLLEAVGVESLLRGSVTSVSQLVSMIDSVSTSDVSAAARKVGSGKLAMAAVGNLSHVPYLDQLK